MKNKPDWENILQILIVVTFVAILGLMVFLKVWVVINYGDMPITEVPSWAIPWLTNGGR
jgi:hypothetical protein